MINFPFGTNGKSIILSVPLHYITLQNFQISGSKWRLASPGVPSDIKSSIDHTIGENRDDCVL